MAFDPRICDLSAALKRMGGNVTLLRQLEQFCRDDLPGFLTRLHAAVAAGDAAQVHRAAHSVKGLVVNFDAAASAAAAIRLEEMGREGNLAQAPAALAELERQVGVLLSTLSDELSRIEQAVPPPS